MTELNRLQTERRAEHARHLEEAALLLQLAVSEGRNYNPQQDGFEFSTPEITRYIDRCHRLNQARELARLAATPVQTSKSASRKAA